MPILSCQEGQGNFLGQLLYLVLFHAFPHKPNISPFVQCHSLETCLLLSDPRLVIQVLNPCISADTKTLGSDVGQCRRAGLWQMHTLFPAFYYPLRSLEVVNFLLVSAQLT